MAFIWIRVMSQKISKMLRKMGSNDKKTKKLWVELSDRKRELIRYQFLYSNKLMYPSLVQGQ